MGRLDDSQGGMRVVTEGGTLGRSLRNFFLTLLVVVVLVTVAVCLGVRTEGGRQFITDGLSSRLGTDVRVAETRIGWPCALVMEGVVSVAEIGEGEPLFQAGEIRVAPGLRTLWRVAVRRCVLNLVLSDEGTWAPPAFARLGDLPLASIAELSRVTAAVRRRVRLDVSESSIRWLNSRHVPMATAGGISFRMAPLRLPERQMFHYRLAVYHVMGPNGARVHDVEREWLASEGRDYVEIGRAGRETPALGRGFWEANE